MLEPCQVAFLQLLQQLNQQYNGMASDLEALVQDLGDQVSLMQSAGAYSVCNIDRNPVTGQFGD